MSRLEVAPTPPIRPEPADGELRVRRGLLRKSQMIVAEEEKEGTRERLVPPKVRAR